MPNPVPSDLHVNTPLTNVSVAYFQDARRYIADRVFPTVAVEKQSDVFYKYTKGDWFRTEVAKRAPGAESVGTGWNVTTDNYFADVWAVHTDVDDQLRANADSTFDVDRDATNLVSNQLLLRRDKEWLSKFFVGSVWDTNVTGVSGTPTGAQVKQWNDAASTPINDVYQYRMSMMEATGFDPNTLVIGPRVWQQLANHPQIIERIKYSQAGFLSEELVAAALGVDRLLIAYAVENTAIEGATTSMNFMAGKSGLLCYTPAAPGLLQPAAGYNFSWRGFLGSGAFGNRIRRYRIEEKSSTRIEGEMSFAMKTISTDLGAYFGSLVA
jgi:Phage major capsid protein E